MMVEVEYETGVLGAALASGSASVGDIVSLDATGDVPLAVSLWLHGGEEVPDLPPNAADLTGTRRLATDGRRALYRVDCAPSFAGVEVYRAAVEHGGTPVAGRAGPLAWTIRIHFPNEAAVDAFRDRCDASGLGVSRTVNGGDGTDRPAERLGVTEAQRQALLAAAEQGYFEVPRRTPLSGLAEELDVSSQATSERLRRGLDSLVPGVLLDGDEGSER